MPTKVTYRNRYNDFITFESADESIVMTIPPDASDFVRVGYYIDSEDEPTNFSMVDPSGGPFIATRKYDGIVVLLIWVIFTHHGKGYLLKILSGLDLVNIN